MTVLANLSARLKSLQLKAAQASAAPAMAEGEDHGQLKSLTRTGAIFIGGFFLLFVVWAIFSQLESAVISQGLVGTQGKRKVVQHLDGGVIRAIMVREGQLVTEGQELIRLDDTQVRAVVDLHRSTVDTESAVTSRLEAETTDADQIEFSDALKSRINEPLVAGLLQSQKLLFAARYSFMRSQAQTLLEQIKQAETQIVIYQGQIETSEKQGRLLAKELAPKKQLFERGLATGSPVYQLQRAGEVIRGQKEEYSGQIIRLTHTIAQLNGQIEQIRSDRRLKIAQELEESRNKLREASERLRIAEDILSRTIIRAPATGYVLGLAVNTVGALVNRGERILEVVPSNGEFVISTRLPPATAIEITEGMRTELRVMTAQGRKLPIIRGTVVKRSVDARPDPQNATPYFDVEVAVDEADLKNIPTLRLVPGTPIEVIVLTGSRTALAYLLDPVSDTFRHAMREQ